MQLLPALIACVCVLGGCSARAPGVAPDDARPVASASAAPEPNASPDPVESERASASSSDPPENPPGNSPEDDGLANDGLAIGELAPYGLESGRAPTVRGPNDGSPQPRLFRSEVAAQIAKLNARLRGCYSKALSTDPSLAGRVVFRFVVDPSGQITSVTIDEEQTSESMRKSPLSACLLAAIRGANIGPTEHSAPVTLSLPVEIKAQTPKVERR